MNTLPKGVYASTKKDNSIYYRASMTYRRKHISLGSYSSIEEAHCAYLEGNRIMHDSSASIREYESTSPLNFEKWVILINFRDNGLYFSTPIYVRGKLFYYYLSPLYALIFDIDELFFYSSHKIMKRNGHLFVADYGMQVNILSRYGIRNYSVPGKDYIFLNGNDTDFRRSNIQIVNKYLGVKKVIKNSKEVYKAKINVPGYYVIGVYPSEIEAAIAYNKAIDILRKNGSQKNYTANYIDELPASKYADIYAHLKISKRIQNITF